MRKSVLRSLLIAAIALFTFAVENVSASGSAYSRGRAFLKEGSPTTAGKVFITTTASAPADGSYVNCTSSTSPAKTVETKGANTTTTYHFWAKANAGYKFTGWYTYSNGVYSPAANQTISGVTYTYTDLHYAIQKKTGADPQGSSNTYVDADLYAGFIKIVQLSFLEPENGSFSIKHNGVDLVGYPSFTVDGVVKLKATPDPGYKFLGWFTSTNGGVTKNYFSFAEECEPNLTANATIGGHFVVDDGKATYWIKGTNQVFNDLGAANTAASSSSSKLIVVVGDGAVTANATISSGVTLLIPYSTDYNLMTTPKVVHITSAGSAPALVAYRKLSIAPGVTITCSGNICVGGQLTSVNGGNPTSQPMGSCGMLDMSRGGTINLNSGSNLYAWGFVKGQDMDQGNNTTDVGQIIAASGATVWEDFQCGEWRGGTASSTIYSNKSSWKFFPFQSYTIQNVEVPVTYQYNSYLKCYWSVFGDGNIYTVSFPLIAKTGSLFNLTASGSTVKKWYDPTTDRVCFALGGAATLDAMTLSVMGESVSTSDYNLPIPANLHIILNSGNSLTISKPMTMHAGSVVEVKTGATLAVSTKVYMYDQADWDTYCMYSYYYRTYKNLTKHFDRGTGTSKATLEDATIIADGTINVTSGRGYIYSTAGGSCIRGNNGGTVAFKGALPSDTTMTQCKVLKDNVSVNIRSANLFNENSTYTQSASSTTYKNVNGRWFVSTAATAKSDHTYDFTYIKSGDVYGSGGTNGTVSAVYSNDKTGVTDRMKWANVKADACDNWWAGLEDSYFYNWTIKSAWHQFIPTTTVIGSGDDAVTVYSGSDGRLYTKAECTWEVFGGTDANCMYEIGGVKKALVNGSFVALTKNTDDEAWHNTSNASEYYICFTSGCNWHPATKIAGYNKAYTVDTQKYIWYNGAWLAVEQEAPFFYSRSATNVKIYYEYVGSAWTIATPIAEVTSASGTREFIRITDVMTYVNSVGENAAIRLLKNLSISSAISYTGNKICTLDLNGFTFTGTVTSMITINNAAATFVIIDQSAGGTGKVNAKFSRSDNKVYGLNITKGHLILNSGTVHVENTHASQGACGVVIKTGHKFSINGGKLEVTSKGESWGVYTESTTTSVVNVNSGIVETSTTSASAATSGIYSLGGIINITGGTIDSKTTTSSNVRSVNLANANSTLNLSGGTVKATAPNTDYGVYVTAGSTANITGGTITSTTTGGTCRGVISYGTTTISGGTISATASGSDAKGVYVANNTTTINAGATVNATATTKSYGIYYADNTPTVVVNGGTFTVSTSSTTEAYGIYAAKGTGTVNNGTFTVTSKTTGAEGMHVETANTPKLTLNDGKFMVKTSNGSANGTINNTGATLANFTMAGGYFNVAPNGTANIAAGKTVKDVDSAKEPTIYSAGYRKKIAGNEYTVTWKDHAGNVIGTSQVESGKVPVWTGGEVNVSDANSTREHDGWCTAAWNGGTSYKFPTALPAIAASDVTYFAHYKSVYAEVIADGATTRYYSAQTAWTEALKKTQATIRILSNLGTEASVGNMTELDFNPTNANSIIMLDLNGHSWTMGNHSTAANNKDIFLKVRKAGCKLIVTDNSASGNGYLLNKRDRSDGILYCASVSAGELVLLGGALKSTNTTASSNSQYAIGVTVASGAKLTMSGGSIHAEDNYSPRALHVAAGGSADVSGGTIKANALNGNAYALLVYGTTSVSDEAVVEAVAATSLAYATQCEGTLNINGGTFKATAAGNARGLFANNGTINVDGNPTVTAKATTGNLAVGAYANNTNGKITIESGTFTVTAEGENSNNAYGVRAVSNGKVTVNGGTFSVRAYKSQSQAIYAETNGNIDINGGEFTVDQNVPGNGNFEGVRVYPGATVNISGGTITVLQKSTSGNAIRCFGGTTNISGTPVFDARYGITINYAVATATAIVVIDGGTFNCLSWGVQSQEVTNSYGTLTGDVTIWDGKFHSTWNAIDTSSPTANLKIRGGWFTNNAGNKLIDYVVSPSTVQTVASGTPEYTADYRYHVLTKYNVTWSVNGVNTVQEYNRNETPSYGSTPTISDGNTYDFVGWSPEIAPVTTDVTYTAVFKKWEAEVIEGEAASGVRFEHFADAFSAAQNLPVAKIKMLSNANITTQIILNPDSAAGSKPLTIDLNNHTLAYTGTSDRFVRIEKAGCTLKVVDSSVAGNGVLKVDKSYNGTLLGVVLSGGELHLESGKIFVRNTMDAKASRGITAGNNSTFTMIGGTLEVYAKNDPRAINSDGRCTVNITGGNILSSNGYDNSGTPAWGTGGGFGAVMWNYGTFNFGGTAVMTVETNASAVGLYCYGTEGKGIVTGGTINATTKTGGTAACVKTHTKGEITIEGGTFNARTATTWACGAIADTNGKMTINGGTFDSQNANQQTTSIWNIEGARVSAGATMTINGGTFTASYGASPIGIGVRGGTTTITGGTFDSKIGLYAMDYADATQTANVVINGGTFIGIAEAVKVQSQVREVKDGEGNVTATYKANANVTINGGYFYSTGSAIVSLNQATNGVASTFVLNGGKYCEKSGTTYKNQITARKGATTTISDINETVGGKTYKYQLTTKFNITWLGGSSYSKTEQVNSGVIPANTECTSFVRNDSTFYFTGWTPTPSPVVGDVTYNAEGDYYQAQVKIGSGAWTKYVDFLEAWDVVQANANCTIALLNNVVLEDKILYKPTVANGRAVFDLNNFTLSVGGTVDRLLEFNKADATLTITDNSTNKGGTLSIVRTSAANVYNTCVHNGELKMTGGRLYVENNQNDANWHPAIAVYVSTSDNAKLTMTDGTLESKAKYCAYTVQSYGITNITGGTVKANSPGLDNGTNGYAVCVYAVQRTTTIGGTAHIEATGLMTINGALVTGWVSNDGNTRLNATLNITGGTFDVTATSKNASCLQVNATTKVVDGTIYGAHGVANVSGGTFNVSCSASTATQVFAAQCLATRHFDTETPHHLIFDEKGELNISGGTFTVDARNDGAWVTNGGNIDLLRSWGTLNVTGGTFTIYQKTTPVGVASYRNKATISGNPVFNINGATSARGVVAGPWNHADYCDADAANNLAEVEVNGGTFNVKAVSGDLTIGAWAYGGLDGNSNYAMNAKLTVNGGEFICINPTANNSRALRQEHTRTGTYGSATAQVIVNGGKFKPLFGTAEPYSSTGTHNVTLPDNNDKRTILTGGYYVHNTELSTFKADTCKVTTLTSSDAEYANGYRYLIEPDYRVKVKSGSVERGFFNLNTALEYAKTVANPTITLVGDANFTGPYSLNPTVSNWTATLDLNNFKITSTTSTDRYFTPTKADAKLTITDNSTDKGGVWNFVQAYNGGLIGIVVDQGELVLAGGKLNIENTTASKTATGVNIWGTSAKFTQTGGTLEVKAPSTATGLSMRGTTAVSGSGTAVTVTSTGGGAKAFTLAADAANSKYGSLSVSGSPTITVSGSNYVYGIHSETAGTTAAVTGGTFNVTASTSYAYGVYYSGTSTVSIKNATFTVDATAGQEAYGIYASGLNTNVTTESSTYNITAKTNIAYALLIATSADIQVKSGTFNATSDATNAVGLLLRSSGTATVKGGTFNVQSGGTGAYAVEIESGAGTAAATIEGGTFTTTTKTDASNSYWNVEGIRIWGNCPNAVINISGGTFTVTNKSKTAMSYGVRTFSGTVNVSGSPTVTAYHAIYIVNQYVSPNTAYVNISGGTFNSTGTCISAYQMTSGSNVNKADITITGGKFKCNNSNNILVSTNTSNLKLQGGYYSNNANNTMENYCVAPKHAVPTTAADKSSVGSDYNWKVALAYKATFKNAETVMQEGYWESGATPVYSGATPTKNPDLNYTYAFSGWSPALGALSADQVYNAQFTTTDNVASVTEGGNTTYYTTVPAAVNYAKTKENPNITILKNTTLTAKYDLVPTISNWRGTLDLNNKTITGSGSSYEILKLNKSDAKLTITDSSDAKGGRLEHIESTDNNAVWGINIASGEVVLTAGTVCAKNTKAGATATKVGICANSATAKLTMTGGKVESIGACQAQGLNINYGTFDISGGEIFVSTELTSGTFGNNAFGIYCGSNAGTNPVTISGSAKLTVKAGNYAYGIYSTKAETYNISGGTIEATANADYAYGIYQTKGTVNLSNSPSVTASASTKAYTFYLTSSGTTLDVQGTGTYNASAKTTAECVNATSSANATLAGGTFTATTNVTNGTTDAHTINVGSSALVTISGGTYTALAKTTQSQTILASVNGKVTITGGTFNSNSTAASNGNVEVVRVWAGTTVNISGGTFNSSVGSGLIGVRAFGGTTTISGGTFNTTEGVRAADTAAGADAKATVNISGGTFNNSWYCLQSSKNTSGSNTTTGNINVSGGKFKTTATNIVNLSTGATLKITGGYYNETSGTTHKNQIETYCVAPKHAIEMTAADKTAIGSDYSWKVVDAYTLTWVTDGDALTGTYTSGLTAAGAAITAPATPTKTGYIFDAWSPALTPNTTSPTMPAANTTYTATWNCVSPTSLTIASTGNKWDFCAGETMTLTVSGSNIAADATYQWKLGGTNIAGATAATYTTTMAAAKAGAYTCTVTNGTCSTTTSDNWIRVWQLYINNGTSDAWQTLDFTNTAANTGNNTTVALTSDKTYKFKLKDNTGGWFGLNSKTVTRTESAFALNGTGTDVNVQSGLAGNYTFTINYANKNNPTIAITYPTADQPGNRNIWFDKSVIADWGADIYYRIGHPSHNTNNTETGGTAWTLVPGTDNFYTTKTMAYNGFEAWQIANNKSWSNSPNSIYKVDGSGFAITKATNFQKYVVGASGVTIVPTTSNNTENGCNYWHVTATEGMLTHTATITTPSNGTIHIAYTDVNSAAQDKTATTSGLAHRTILTVTATPASGYKLGTLTVNGVAISSGDTHILSADATIAATFAMESIGEYLDIADWTSTNEVVLNMNGYTSATAKAGWTIRVNGDDAKRYTKTQRDNEELNPAKDRTMKINLSGLGLAADGEVLIEALGTADAVESYHRYKVPHIFNASATLSGTSATSIVYVHSGTLTVNSNLTVGRIYVCPGAKLVINSGKTLTVKDRLVMRTHTKQNVDYRAPELVNNGTLTFDTGAKMYYSRIVADNTQLYPIGFPYEVTLANVELSSGKPAVRGTHYALQYYDSERRALYGADGGNWDLYEGATMVAKTGYLLLSTSKYYYEYMFPVIYNKSAPATVSVKAYSSANAGDAGWNMCVSPFTSTSSITSAVPSQILKVSKLYEDNVNYYQDAATNLEPAVPFYMQVDADATLNFSASGAGMRRRAHSVLCANSHTDYSDNTVQEQWIRLSYSESKPEEQKPMSDITNIFLHPSRFTAEYETGVDVIKMSKTGARPFIYTTLECGDLAFTAVPDETAEAGIPLTVWSPVAGDYTFSLEKNDYLERFDHLWLVDALYGDMIDLLENDYTIDVAEGTTAGRFSLMGMMRSPEITTGVENQDGDGSGVADGAEKPRKIYRDGYMYILMPNGDVYSIGGKKTSLK